MANEVNITITATDLTGPAFASALAKMEALKKAAKDTGAEFAQIGVGGFDLNKAGQYLTQLRSKIQSLGIADLADVNVPQGKLITQLAVLKRIVQQSGISDLIDMNVNPEEVNTQLAKISAETATIPVNFDLGKLPDIPKVGPTEVIPVKYTTSPINTPEIGSNLSQNFDIGISPSTVSAMNELINDTYKLNAGFGDLKGYLASAVTGIRSAGSAMLEGAKDSAAFWASMLPIGPGFASIGEKIKSFGSTTTESVNSTVTSLAQIKPAAQDSTNGLTTMAAAGALLGGNRLGGFGWLTAQIPLFGGALAGALPIILSHVAAWHLLADGIVEFSAVVIPAGIALGAFAAASASTVNDMVNKETALFTITTALGTSFPGLSSGLQHFTDSVKPEVYTLFGEALGVINAHTGLFQTLATGAGQVLDNLGARAALALGGSGLTGLISKGDEDLQVLGNIIGNVFGIFGNLLKTMPGYAQPIFMAIQDVTGAIEQFTASPVVQGIIKVGLAFHGVWLYSGVLVTGTLALIGAIGRLGAAFLTFGQAQVLSGVAGLQTLGAAVARAVVWAIGYGGALLAIASEEGVVAAASLVMSDAIAAIPGFGWALIAVTGLTALALWLVNTKTAAQQLFSTIESNVSSASTFTTAFLDLSQGLQQVNTQLQNTAQYTDQVTTQSKFSQQVIAGVLNPAYQQLKGVQSQLSDQQVTLSNRMAQLDNITGSQANTLADLNSLNIKAGSIATDTAGQYANLKEQIQGLSTATTQLAGYTSGQALAAQNALTNLWVNETLPAITKITTAEGNMIANIVGGEDALDTFELGLKTLSTNAGLAGNNMDGTGQASYTMNQSFLASITSAQGLFGALQQQSISQSDLTKVVATSAGQMLGFAGTSSSARSVIVDLINNALGPGTVTLKNLNQWIGTNGTSLSGMNGIVEQSTAKAGTLNGVLSTTLQNMQAIAIFQAHGGQSAWNTFTTDLITGKTKSDAFKQSTIDVMDQLFAQSNNSLPAAHRAFNTYIVQDLGGTQKEADALWKTYLPGLQNEIDSMHGKSINVNVAGSGSGGVNISPHGISGAKAAAISLGQFYAGGLVGGSLGTNGPDDRLATVRTGEFVVKPGPTSKFLPLLKKINSYAGGGLVDMENNTASYLSNDSVTGIQADILSALQMYQSQEQAAAQAAAAMSALNYLPLGSGPLSSSAAVAQAFARSILFAYGWTQAQWPYELALWNRESGWNAYAANPTSDARGIPQNINGWSAYAPGDYQAQIRWGDAYISSRYGTPAAAWGHEVAYGWYDNGGWLRPGMNVMMNGTGGWEHLSRDTGSSSSTDLTIDSGGQSAFEQFMVMAIREWVVRKGGGNVQKAFGRPGK